MHANTSPWHGRRVLVTGCTGFLGSAVTRDLLDHGAIVVGLIRDRASGVGYSREREAGRFHVAHGRVEDSARLHSTMAVHEVTAVFHLADADPFGDQRGTAAVQRAVSLHHPQIPLVTSRPTGQLRIARGEETRLPGAAVARFGEIYGPGDRKVFRVVPRTVIGLLTNEPHASEDDPTRDFVFVRDAARACLQLAEVVGREGEPRDCTFRSGWECSGREMARFVSDVFRGQASTPDLRETSRNPVGWRPTVSADVGIGETIAWYREFLSTRFFGTRTNAAKRKAA